MKKTFFILLLFLYANAFSQQNELRSFFFKYFMGLDNSKYYTEWIKTLSEDTRLERDMSDTSFNKRGLTCYKIKQHSLIQSDSTRASLRYILSTEYQTSSGQVSDSLFTMLLFINYGKDKHAKKTMNKNYKMVSREKIKYTSTTTVQSENNSPGDKSESYIGQSYDFNNKKIMPAPLMIARSKRGSQEHVLLIYYFTHYSINQ